MSFTSHIKPSESRCASSESLYGINPSFPVVNSNMFQDVKFVKTFKYKQFVKNFKYKQHLKRTVMKKITQALPISSKEEIDMEL